MSYLELDLLEYTLPVHLSVKGGINSKEMEGNGFIKPNDRVLVVFYHKKKLQVLLLLIELLHMLTQH